MGVTYNRSVELANEINAIAPKSFDLGSFLPTGKVLSRDEYSNIAKKIRNNRQNVKKEKNALVPGSQAQQDLIDALELQNDWLNSVQKSHKEARKAKAAESSSERRAQQAEKNNVNSQLKIQQQDREQEKINSELKRLKAEKLAMETSLNSNEINKESSGFKSLTESTKPKTARLNKPEPSISIMTENVPSGSVTKSPANKSNIDTLVAATTQNRKNLNKVFTSGSAKGIKTTLQSSTIQKSNNINSTQADDIVNNLQGLKNDPFIQQGMKDAGLSDKEIKEVNDEIDKGAAVVANSFVSPEKVKEKTVEPQKQFSVKQFKSLGNPMGSPGTQLPNLGGIPNIVGSLGSKVNKNPLGSLSNSKFGAALESFSNGANPISPGNPFGSLGVEFGNVLASVVGLVQGVGAFSELGKSIPSLPGGIDPRNGATAPNIVEQTGRTKISKVVNKGTKTAVNEPTTPVKSVGKTRTTGIDALGYNDLDNEFWGDYEPVNSKKELELEIKNSPRTIRNLIVCWSATAENEFYTARSYNEKKYKNFLKKPRGLRPIAGSPIGRKGYRRCNYFIRKDGVVERMIPIGTAPTTFGASKLSNESRSKYQKVFDEGIMIQFDAGILGDAPEAGLNYSNLSDKSITAEQWKSFDMIADVMYRHSPGGTFKGVDQLLNESEGVLRDDETPLEQLQQISKMVKLVGPQFDVGEYLEKKREIPDGDDGAEDPYSDISDEYLNDDEPEETAGLRG